jgi:hypothetical protein
MMQKSTTITTIFRVKKCYFHYDFACKNAKMQKIKFYSLSVKNKNRK